MKYLIVSAFAAIGFLVATPLWRLHSASIVDPTGPANAISVQELHRGSGANTLAVEEFEDLSLVFTAGKKY